MNIVFRARKYTRSFTRLQNLMHEFHERVSRATDGTISFVIKCNFDAAVQLIYPQRRNGHSWLDVLVAQRKIIVGVYAGNARLDTSAGAGST